MTMVIITPTIHSLSKVYLYFIITIILSIFITMFFFYPTFLPYGLEPSAGFIYHNLTLQKDESFKQCINKTFKEYNFRVFSKDPFSMTVYKKDGSIPFYSIGSSLKYKIVKNGNHHKMVLF